MLFSVIIPVFNSERYLRKCLKSIVNQTYKDFEVVIVDDGSTDSSPEILDEFASKDTRIKVYHFKNRGVTKARQIGVLLSRGEYILFVDSDDTINLELLSMIKKTIDNFPNVEMIRFKCRMINDKPGYDHELYNDYNSEYNVVYSGLEAIKKWTNPDKRYEIFWLYAIKRQQAEIIQKAPNFKSSGDYAIVPLIIASSKEVVMINYIGYNYTCDNYDSITHSLGTEREKERALNFISAYCYLITNMRIIGEESDFDLQFFYTEWKQRLQRRYSVISEPLKIELRAKFKQALEK